MVILIALWVVGFFYLSWYAWLWCFVVSVFAVCMILSDETRISRIYTYDKDIKSIKSWYHRAGEQGHAEAQYRLGILYDKEGNYSEAHMWFTKAAQNGHSGAAEKLRTFGKGYGGK